MQRQTSTGSRSMGCLYRLSSTTRQCKEFPTTARLSRLPRANGVACQDISIHFRKSELQTSSNMILLCLIYVCSFLLVFASWSNDSTSFDFHILSLASRQQQGKWQVCQVVTSLLERQVEWLQRRLLHQWLGMQQQLWIKVGPTSLEKVSHGGTPIVDGLLGKIQWMI